MRKTFALLASLTAAVAAAAAGLEVRETGDGVFAVYRDGVAVVTDLKPLMADGVPCEKSFGKAPDGSKVWNRWNKTNRDNFRFEAVERADGAVEFSILGACVGRTPNRSRTLRFKLPGAVFAGAPCDYRTMYRLYSGSYKCTLASDMKPFDTRYFAAAGLVFNGDPNPAGVFSSSRTGCPGRFNVKPDGAGGFDVVGAAQLPLDSNEEAGDKLVIHPGTFADFPKDHFLPSFNIYHDRWFPLYQLKFGAPKAGAGYVEGNSRFEKRCGWVGAEKMPVKVGHPTGAYYSHAYGSGTATYRLANLHAGWYVFTFQLGNWTGEKCDFALSVNGEKLGEHIRVKPGEARTVARAIHVTEGRVDVRFEGDWLLSGIGVQPFLSDNEDFMMRRGFWYVDGYEPSVVRQNRYTRPAVPRTFDQTVAMPPPGREAAAAWREPPKPVEVLDRTAPKNRWMYHLNMRNVNLGGIGNYYADDAARAAFVDDSAKQRYNAFMLHGNLCRHLMAEPHVKNVDEQIQKFVDDAHRRGIKFVDHMDVTLAWASEYGFRAYIENLDCAMLDFNNNLPTYLLCLENPRWKKRFFDYLRAKLEKGVDGFQLDEMSYWRHGCGCGHCRGKFARETGWSFPLDETNGSCRWMAKTELYSRWSEWQMGNITNWRIDLRRYVKDVNPDFYMSTYTTYAGQTSRACLLGSFMDSARTMSMLGTEVMQQDVMRCSRPLMSLARLKNVYRLAYGMPSWNWFYNSSYANEVFAFAVCSMNGEVPLLTGSWLGATYDPAFANPVEWAAKARAMDIEGAFPVAEVGLLFSYQSCRNNKGDNHTPEILGVAQELEVMHVPYEFFGDISCRYEQLRNYKVVFIGEAQCLSDVEIGALKTFVANGGRVYGRPGCGTRDALGAVRANPLAGYVEMPSAMPFYEEEHPERGKDKGPWFTCDPVAEAKFRAYLAACVKGAEWWKVEGAPDKLYTSVFREKSGEIVVHFLNGTGCDLWKDGQFVSLRSRAKFPPLKEDVFFEVPAAVGTRAFALGPELGDREVALEATPTDDGTLRVRVPKELLDVYLLVRFTTKRPDVLCIYYPEWHAYPEGDAIFGKGRTEWDLVNTAVPRFEGHCQPIGLADGNPDDADPADVAKEIDYAADAGIDVFLYDWYWADGHPIQHEALERGFLKAPNRERLKFALMWANHDRSNAFRPAPGEAGARYYWKLAWTAEEFEAALDYCIRTYFPSPLYYRKDGRLFFSVYGAGKLIRKIGGAEKMKATLARVQAKAKAAGLPPIHFSTMIHSSDDPAAIVAAGYDSVSAYNVSPDEFDDNEVEKVARGAETRVYSFDEFAALQREVNGKNATVSTLPYLPVACRGWDTSPRCPLELKFPWKTAEYPFMSIVHGFSKEGFVRVLKDVRRQAERDPKNPGAVIVNGWNEYTEGCYLMPDKWTGRAGLDAVRAVFGNQRP